MSWSWAGAGKPSALKRALSTYGAVLTGASREEFDQARPALDTLLDANTDDRAVVVEANGHAYTDDGGRHATCAVSVRPIGLLAE